MAISKSAIARDILTALDGRGTARDLPRGAVLVEEGSPAGSFFIVESGRFHVMRGEEPIAVISSGEPIGEIAFFAGGVRTATVVAARPARVIEITRDAYAALAAELPELNAAIIRSLSERLRRGVGSTRTLMPRPGEVIGLLPAGGGPLDPAFSAALITAVTAPGDAVHLKPSADADAVQAALAEGRRVILSAADAGATESWERFILDQADTVLLVADRRSGRDLARRSAAEERAARQLLAPALHLAILRAPGAAPKGADVLDSRSVGMHHHMEAGSEADVARVARFLRGEALGVVFGGGGAFGTAHLAVVKALQEAGVVFDMAGGASIGAAMAAIYAMGLEPDEVIDRFDDLFVKSRAMKRFTVPRYSIIDHKFFDRELARHFEGRLVEDLALPFFAVSTSLTRNDLSVLRRGPVWRAVRASSSIPAVFPPIVAGDGEVLIDGAFMDNVPVETMRELKPGRNLVLSLGSKADWRVTTDYDALPTRRAQAARFVLGPLVRRVRFPGIFSIMTRSMIVNSERHLRTVEPRDDVFLPLPPLKGMGFLDWAKARTLYDRTYRTASEALDGLSGPDLLEQFAARMTGAEEGQANAP